MLPPPLQKTFSTRKIRMKISLAGIGFFLLFLLLGARAFELHLTDNSKLSRLAKTQYQRRVVVAPKRGNILDTHEDTLAIDIQVDSAYATPNTIADSKAFAKSVGPLLNLSEKFILEKIADKNKKFVWLKRRIPIEESKKLHEAKLANLGTLPEHKRFYPNGPLAANLLGAVGYDAMALAGLEMTFDKFLKSEDPPLLVEQDAKGRSYTPFALAGLEHPHDVVLTLDKTIQYIAERELKSVVEKRHAKGGIALVVEVSTGALLAMAVQPSFDPNEYSKYDFSQWRNRAVTDVYEPGSIFKAFTAAAALETGTFNLTQTLNCENGAMQVGKFTINDHHGYGLLNLRDIIKYSSNICSYKLAQRVGKKRFYEILTSFGFGRPTGLPIPGEAGGVVASYENFTPLQMGTTAFGQGISVTPLQIAMAYTAIANGGKLLKPLLVKEIRDFNGQKVQSFAPEILRQVIREETAQKLSRLLETVIEKGGTGTSARLEGYRVAGKTGTAQKVNPGQKGYAKNQYVASFVGYAPARDPKLVVLVSIDEPRGDYYGGIVSAPVFREIMNQSLAYLKVAPDPVYLAENGNKDKDIKTAPERDISASVPNDGPPEPLVSHEPGEWLVPNLTGLSVREALRRSQSEGLKIQIRGSGVCNRQEPLAGVKVAAGTAVVLECQPPI
jgi:cell division protein FtsI (penicillin-binding protein 3)